VHRTLEMFIRSQLAGLSVEISATTGY